MREYIKELSSHREAIEYANKFWNYFFVNLEEPFKSYVLSIESQGRFADCCNDKLVIDALERAIKIIPPFEEDVIVYRGGRKTDFCPNRPFLSATFLKTTGENFAEKEGRELLKIIIRKGARAIPVCAAGLGYLHEEEVIIASQYIHFTETENVYEYFE